MAHKRPWYQRNGGEFLVGCMDLPDIETKWAYSAILDMLNDRDRPIADDPGFVCGFTGLSKRKWAQVRQTLLDNHKLIILPDGRLSNPRFERERLARMSDHERKVELGRMGGKKSGEVRAAQRTLNLENDDNRDENEAEELKSHDKNEATPSPLREETKTAPEIANESQQEINGRKTGDKREINGRLSGDNSTPTIENMEEKRSSRGRARARQTPDSRIRTNKQAVARDAAHARAREGSAGLPVCLPEFSSDDDLSKAALACCEAAGLAARVRRNPDMWQAARETVAGWQEAGINVGRVAVPAIKRTLRAMGDEPANSLARFTVAVDKAQASQRGQPAPPVRAEFVFADEAPEMCNFRKALAQKLGVARYAGLAAAVVFAVGDREPGDRGVLWITPRNPNRAWEATRAAELNRPAILQTASRLFGIKHVWDRSFGPHGSVSASGKPP